MKVLSLQNKADDSLDILVRVNRMEFKQWSGELNALCTFSPDTLLVPARANKTGARKSAANWLLFPVVLRRKYKTNQYDFDNITCGVLEQQGRLFVIYSIPKKELGFL